MSFACSLTDNTHEPHAPTHSSPTQSLHINTTRSHVTSRHYHRGPCLCSPFRSGTSGLTSLRVAIEEPYDPCYKQMLTDNQFTLTDLHIDRVGAANVFDIIPPVRVPNLRRLSLSSHFDNREFLALHAAQLTRLRLDLTDAQLVFADVTDLHLRCAAIPSISMLRSNFPRLRDLRITMTRDVHVAAEIQDFAAFIQAASPFLVSLASTNTRGAPLVECARLRVLETLPTLEPPLPQLRAYVSMRVSPTANLRTLHLYTNDFGTQESFPSSLSTLRIYLSAHKSDSIAPLNLASFNTLLTTLAAECPRLRVFGLWTDRPLLATQLSALHAFLRGALRRSLTRFISFALYAVDSTDKNSRLSVAQILRSDAALDCLTVSEVLCDSRPPIDLLRAEEEEEED